MLERWLWWLKTTFQAGEQPPWDVMTARLVAAALLGGLAAAFYALTHRRDQTFTINFVATLVMLSILLATVTQVIGDNLARAFGLVGALAIVRFRTVVEDTRDTAFVMLAVVLGMAVGAGYLALALITLVIAALVALLLQPRRGVAANGPERWTLSLRIGVGHDLDGLTNAAFTDRVAMFRLLATSTARQGAALELTWTIELLPGIDPAALVANLNRLEGVQNVEMRRA